MPKLLRSVHSHTPAEAPPIVHLWLLRLLVPLGAHREFIHQNGFGNDALAEMVGLSKWLDPSPRDFEVKTVLSELRKFHETAERKLRDSTPPPSLRRNIARLAKLVGLSDTDCRILEFAVMIQNEVVLEDTAHWLGQLSSVKAFHAISVVLDLAEPEVRASLCAKGILAKSGLVGFSRVGNSRLREKLDLLSENFADNISTSDSDPVSLLRDTVALGSPAQLGIVDYDHITTSLAVLRPYLKQSIASGRTGVNVFLHGAPGTGKSQLAKALAQELNCELFEVASEDGEGYPVSGERRLRAFRAAQSFFSQRRVLILFDEVEDVFNDGGTYGGPRSTAQSSKAWINRMLEENAVPTLWLSNCIQGIDPAFVRRFDMVVELPVPPKKQRERILLEACADLLGASTIARIAESESLAPAVVTRAASVVRSIRGELWENGAAAAFELLIGNTLEAQGHKPVRRNDPTERIQDVPE